MPYIPRIRAPREPEIQVIEGVPPPSLSAITYVSTLPKADIPGHLLSALAVSSGPSTSEENIQSVQRAFLPKIFDAESHGRHFKTLLWIEEYKMGCVIKFEHSQFSNVTFGHFSPRKGKTSRGTTWLTQP